MTRCPGNCSRLGRDNEVFAGHAGGPLVVGGLPSPGRKARKAIADTTNEIFFSSASAYEIFQKVRLGRLVIPAKIQQNLTSVVREEGWTPQPLSLSDAVRSASLDHAHRDSFDRMLAAQCQIGSFQIASVDAVFDELSLERVW